MITNTTIARHALRAGAAMQALALMGAGAAMMTVAVPAVAQDYTQVNATGRVLGTDGKAIAGANVTVTSVAQGFTRSAVTGQDGSYVISALPQGTYSFTVSAEGYQSFTDSTVRLIQGRAANQFNLQLTDASTGEDIVVTAGRVQVVDFSSNTVGQTVDVADSRCGSLLPAISRRSSCWHPERQAATIDLAPCATAGSRLSTAGRYPKISITSTG